MTFEHPERDTIDISAVLHALSDPQRLGMVAELATSEEPRPCGSFAPGITKSTRTHHFRVLREAGLVEQWREELERKFGLPTAMAGRADFDAGRDRPGEERLAHARHVLDQNMPLRQQGDDGQPNHFRLAENDRPDVL